MKPGNSITTPTVDATTLHSSSRQFWI